VAPRAANASSASLRNLFSRPLYNHMEAEVEFAPSYPAALRQAKNRAGRSGFVASLPQMLAARVKSPSFENEIWQSMFTALSDESVVTAPSTDGGNGTRKVLVVTVHGGGIFSSASRIEEAFLMDTTSMTGHYAAQLSDGEVERLINGSLLDGSAVPMYSYEQFKAMTTPPTTNGSDTSSASEYVTESELPGRYGVITDGALAMKSPRGYTALETMRHDPMFIVHAGGVEAASKYIDKLKERGQDTLGSWPPFSEVQNLAHPQEARILSLDADGGVAAGNGVVWYGRYIAVAPQPAGTSLRPLNYRL
jgi:hypothetical protein